MSFRTRANGAGPHPRHNFKSLLEHPNSAAIVNIPRSNGIPMAVATHVHEHVEESGVTYNPTDKTIRVEGIDDETGERRAVIVSTDPYNPTRMADADNGTIKALRIARSLGTGRSRKNEYGPATSQFTKNYVFYVYYGGLSINYVRATKSVETYYVTARLKSEL